MEDKEKMQAIIWTKYGGPDGLKLQEVVKPTPKENEVLIKVKAASVMAGDCELRSLKMPMGLGYPMRLYTGIKKPTNIKILGQDFSGEIEAVGKDVTRFKKGDNIFGNTGFKFGSYAQYNCLPVDNNEVTLLHNPSNMSFTEAAAIPTGAINSIYFLKKGNIRPGQHVLINGAGGSIGTIGVQYAKYLGAIVTAVDSTTKLDMLRSIGADFVVDYKHEDFSKNGKVYDVFLDVIGRAPLRKALRSVRKGGYYINANPTIRLYLIKFFTSLLSRRKVITGTESGAYDTLKEAVKLIEDGTIKPVIHKTYPLEQTPEAHLFVETEPKIGNVIVSIIHDE